MYTTYSSTSGPVCIPERGHKKLRPGDRARAQKLDAALAAFESGGTALPGIGEPESRATFLEQLVESIRRIEYAHFVRDERFDSGRADPHTRIFDPLRAAVYWARNGNLDEAFWLVFLFVHFGRHPKDRWRLVRDVYGALGGEPWTWDRVAKNPQAFRDWLIANEHRLKDDGISRRFGNHRKYESLNPRSPKGTAAVIESYVAWVGPSRSHRELIQKAHKEVGQNPRETFHHLYRSMAAVARFGRLAKFEYLAMLGKLGLAPLDPPSAYLNGATGPLSGARLLFGGTQTANLSPKELDAQLLELDSHLHVGMQVLEDALCNWQKSPKTFTPFRG